MSEMPDISKIIGLIMQNPALISQIQSMAKSEEEKTQTAQPPTITDEAAVSAKPEEATAEVSLPITDTRHKRNKLLYAMKPYLSEERSKAIDSMLSIAQILDMMKSR